MDRVSEIAWTNGGEVMTRNNVGCLITPLHREAAPLPPAEFFALNASVGGRPNGAVSLVYNGASILGTPDANFTLPIVATVTTGPVYGPLAANGKTDRFVEGELTFTISRC